ncbi:MAG: RNA methyltransferase [Holosporaceae bacterium]
MGQPAFILMKPQLAENVGTAVRALWNCGMDDLRLVTPKTSWPSDKGLKAAAGAAKKAACVQTFQTLKEAAADVDVLIATTVRERDMTKPVYSLETLMPFLEDVRQKAAQKPKMGFVFGPERTGLNSDDVSRAHGILTIDLNPLYGSLNLAQAVLLVAYTYRSWQSKQKQDAAPPVGAVADMLEGQELVTQKDLSGFLDHFESVLAEAGFFHPPEMQPKMARNIRNIFTRALLTDQEVRTLRGVVHHFEKILKGAYKPRPKG